MELKKFINNITEGKDNHDKLVKKIMKKFVEDHPEAVKFDDEKWSDYIEDVIDDMELEDDSPKAEKLRDALLAYSAD